jgi:hypothetical protein
MRNWSNRAKEIAYLLNPAFCARLLYNAIGTYSVESKRAFPFPLIYIILPLLLHRSTREKINSRTQLLNWIQQNESLLIGFADRARQLVPITNEALEILLQSELLAINANAELETSHNHASLNKNQYTDNEINECIIKSAHIAKWLARAGRVETIYFSFGVRP